MSVYFGLPPLYFYAMHSFMTDKIPATERKKEAWRLRLRQALDDRQLDYSVVSAEAGYNEAYVSKIFQGVLNPTVDRVLKICDVAKIAPAYLFSDNARIAGQVLPKVEGLSEADAQRLERLVASSVKKD